MNVDIVRKFARLYVKYLFLPTRLELRGPLSKFWLFFLVFAFIVVVVLAAPPVIEFILCTQLSPDERVSLKGNEKILLEWLSFVSIFLEVTIALAIGGSIFGERLANKFKKAVTAYEESRTLVLEARKTGLNDEISKTVDAIIDLFSNKTLLQFVSNIPKLWKLAKNLRRMLFDEMPTFQRRYITLMMYSTFPGGLYGLIAFLSFFALSIIKVFQLYIPKAGIVCP